MVRKRTGNRKYKSHYSLIYIIPFLWQEITKGQAEFPMIKSLRQRHAPWLHLSIRLEIFFSLLFPHLMRTSLRLPPSFPKGILGNSAVPWQGKTPDSHFIDFLMSVEPPSPTGKIQHRLKFLAFKTCSNCIGSSWNSSTERPERPLHWCCEPPCLQQSALGVPLCMKSSLTSVSRRPDTHGSYVTFMPCRINRNLNSLSKLTSILISLVA